MFLVPLALTLGAIGLMGFLWSLKNGQYDDLDAHDVSLADRLKPKTLLSRET